METTDGPSSSQVIWDAWHSYGELGDSWASSMAPAAKLYTNGNLGLAGTVGAVGADFAEWRESASGRPLPYGAVVGLDAEGKLVVAASPAEACGVIRPASSATIIGNAADLHWHGMYLKDDFGGFVEDDDGVRVVNPDYDPTQPYIPRCKRPEWNVMGIAGFVVVDEPYFSVVAPHWRLCREFTKKAGGLAREYLI